MSARRKAAALGAIAASSLLIGAFTPGTASAHGTISTPISRVFACYSEGPEHPVSQVCKDLVADSTTQPLYDWNGVNQANANGQSQTLIPDGKLCSANKTEFRDLDWARTDWAATPVSAGSTTINFRVTAPHKGTMTLYMTKQGYSATSPLKWSNLDLAAPIASYTTVATTPASGYYTFNATLPARTGRQLIYMVWQRTDSPEAFYSCSDVVYGASAAAVAAAPKAATDAQIAADASKSTVSHAGHDSAQTLTTLNAASAASATDTHSASATLEAALSGSALLATGALGLLFWSRRKATARDGS